MNTTKNCRQIPCDKYSVMVGLKGVTTTTVHSKLHNLIIWTYGHGMVSECACWKETISFTAIFVLSSL
jgi:hypothetical protein